MSRTFWTWNGAWIALTTWGCVSMASWTVPAWSAEAIDCSSGMLRNLAVASETGPPHQLGFAFTVKVWFGVHSTNSNGPVPIGFVATDPSSMAFLETMPRLSEVSP